ncbi:unnamed protein product [Arctogadus glacialis]
MPSIPGSTAHNLIPPGRFSRAEFFHSGPPRFINDGASGGPAWLSGVPSCTSSLGGRRAEPLPGSPVILSIKTGDCLFTKSAPLGIAAVQS